MTRLVDYQAGQSILVAYSAREEELAKEEASHAQKGAATVKLVPVNLVASAPMKDAAKVAK